MEEGYPMRLHVLTVIATLVTAACASPGQTDGGNAGETVQLTVINEYSGTATAYAVWGSGRVRLGDVGQNRTRVFMTPRRSDRVAIGFQAIGAPPAATSAGPPRLRGGNNANEPDPSSPYMVSEAIDVVPGDAIEFRFSAAGIITVLRLQPGN
jgi:hypothetical protein